MVIQQSVQQSAALKSHVILEYDVPLREGKAIKAKAVNWPKVFLVGGITPCRDGEKPKEKLLEFLTLHQVPIGTELKFSNTLDFFDHAMKENEKLRSLLRGRQSERLHRCTKSRIRIEA